MDPVAHLQSRAQEQRSILCFGVDPVLEEMYPEDGPHQEQHIDSAISSYFDPIIDKLLAEHLITALKPNYAYFAQYGFEGLYALQNLMNRYQGKIFLILDAKRGDIGRSSEAYAKEAYDIFHADAVTVSPYMGYDSVQPFVRKGKLAYMLCRTSNRGALDFQEKKLGRSFLYQEVAKKSVAWNTGLVVGATSDAVGAIAKVTNNQVPFLIPGVGSQGGDMNMTLRSLKANPYIHRINASSSIAYAYKKAGGTPTDAAHKEAQKLVECMRKHL